MKWYLVDTDGNVIVGGFSTQADARIAKRWVESVTKRILRVEAR